MYIIYIIIEEINSLPGGDHPTAFNDISRLIPYKNLIIILEVKMDAQEV